MLKTESLPKKTRALFDFLTGVDLLCDFTLIGGTAMALQLGHRRSEDLDFWVGSEVLDKAVVSKIVRTAQDGGFEAALATPTSQIVAAKINGVDVLSYAQDYLIGGVNVTFFARNDLAYRCFDQQARVADMKTAFRLMGLEGLFMMKSHMIHHRTRSRDLFDLRTFLQNGKSLQAIFDAGKQADPAYSTEYAKSVLIGQIPLDKQDEGFDSIGVSESIDDLYAFFRAEVDAMEQAIAEDTLRKIIELPDNGSPAP